MSISSENMLKLMAYADGELEGEERKEAEKLLATDPDSVRFVEQIAGLGEIVARGHAVRSGKAIATFDVADAVMAAVKETPVAKVASLAAAREKAAEKRAMSPGMKLGAGVAAALALAASIFVFAQHRTDETPMAKAPVTSPSPQPIPYPNGANAQAAVNTSPGLGVEVNTVNSPGNSVSVFYLPTANELSTSVFVWVDESGDKK
jgi:anti-sigma factor RsiW